MIFRLAKRAFASAPQRALNRYKETSEKILRQDSETRLLSAASLRDRARALRKRVAEGADINHFEVPTFALVREASRRQLGEAHTPAQLVAGLAMNDGYIAEMQT
ncbi:MAG: preprotein translocase subunit SecA, partial [Tardiphaga sp.]